MVIKRKTPEAETASLFVLRMMMIKSGSRTFRIFVDSLSFPF